MQTSTPTSNLVHQTESDAQFHYTSDFLEWLREEEISIAFSTYQTNKLFLVGRDTTKHLFVSENYFDRAMGLHVESENSIYLSTRFLLWRFENALAKDQKHQEADKVYIPRQAFNTGDLNVHDVSIDENGDIVFVNTRYNCLSKVSEKHNFKPLWMPPFINKMVAEDRCHLNGLAMRDKKPRYVTAVSQTNLLDSWRDHRENGGIVMDVETSEVLVDGLSMPHSPRYYQDKVWVLNAGRGEFGYVENGEFIVKAQLDGFLRGLAFHKNYALIGLSKPRHEQTFTGLPLDEMLQAKNTLPQCGICIVDINTGELVHNFEIKGKVVELYDVQILPNVVRPSGLDLRDETVSRYISIEGDDDTVDFKALVMIDEALGQKPKGTPFQPPYTPTKLKEEEEKLSKTQPQPIAHSVQQQIPPATTSFTSSPDTIKYQVAGQISTQQIIQQFDNLTFPKISLQSKARKFREPLVMIIAKNPQHFVGAIVIEVHPNSAAKVLSWYVLPPYRDLGVGKELLSRAEKILGKNNFNSLHIEYRSDWKSADKFEHILSSKKWEEPKTKVYLCKSSMDVILKAPWMKRLELPQDMELFLWKDLTPEEKNNILHKKRTQNWYDNSVDPFQHQTNMDLTSSTGLRHGGEVIGWMVTHRLKQDTVEFTAAFVDENAVTGLRKHSLFLPVLAKCLHFLREDGAKYGIWQMSVDNPSIQKFVEKFLKPYLISFVESKFSYKIL